MFGFLLFDEQLKLYFHDLDDNSRTETKAVDFVSIFVEITPD